MLSGKSSEDLIKNATFPPPFDEFQFIWKNFSESNYITYFNEDWLWLSVLKSYEDIKSADYDGCNGK